MKLCHVKIVDRNGSKCYRVEGGELRTVFTELFELGYKNYMVTVDYFSSFFEIDRLYDLLASTVIKKLKADMQLYGI